MKANTPEIKNKAIRLKLKAIQDVLSFYPQWGKWSRSAYCPLTKKQVNSINNYLQYGHHGLTTVMYDITGERADQIMKKALRSLDHYHKNYEAWKIAELLKESGIFEKMTPRDKFLSTPVYGFEFSSKLLGFFSATDCERMRDVVKYRKSQLLKFRSIGKKSIMEIEKVLAEHECSDLLRQ